MQKPKSKLSGAKMRILRLTTDAQDKTGLETQLLGGKLGQLPFLRGENWISFLVAWTWTIKTYVKKINQYREELVETIKRY